MKIQQKVLWWGQTPAPANVRQAVPNGWQLRTYRPGEPLGQQLTGACLALIQPNGQANDAQLLDRLLDDLERTATVGLFLLPAPGENGKNSWPWEFIARRKGQFVCIREDAAAEQLGAQLTAAAQLQPLIVHLQSELAAARMSADRVADISKTFDEEMRLAARLQRDFLPRRLPEVGPVRFATLFRPATWVSGDIYDVVRLDESHVGFYVADAVGHGMPAALLTMFIKKALQTKRIVGNTYEIVPPHVSLAELNADICEQALAGCQFCTALYCVIDTSALTLTFARAGHPEPVLMRADGSLRRLEVPGTILGVLEEETYQSRTIPLAAGDRLLLYTDGAEPIFRGAAPLNSDIEQHLATWRDMPRDEFILRLTSTVERLQKPPDDDITVIVADIGRN